MDLATLIGFALGFGAIVYGIIGSGVPFSAFIDPPSLLIVLGGTIAALFINFPLERVLSVMKVLPLTFQAKQFDPVPIVTQLVEMADAGAKRGAAALEQMSQELPDPFMRQGMELVASNAPDEQIRYVLETELQFMEERHEEGEKIVSGFADYAPAFGLVGTLIGLVAMLAGLGGGGGGGSAVEAVASGMAVALITTFYGAIFQNLVGLPLAGKLKAANATEAAYKRVVIEGILMVSQGMRESLPPNILAARLAMYLPPDRREELSPSA